MEYRKLIHEYTLQHSGEMLELLKELVRIRSDRSDARPGMPYGEYVANILSYVDGLYKNYGFISRLSQEGGYTVAEYGQGEKSIGIFAHADAVTCADDWTLTGAFEPLEKDGWLIGRGTKDDKAAIVMSLFFARMLKELNIPFESRLVLFTGGNEETGMEDVPAFLKEENAPDFTLVEDCAYPIYIGDKGGMGLQYRGKRPLAKIKDFHGGRSLNVILGYVEAEFDYDEKLERELTALLNENTALSHCRDKLVFSAKGVSTHGALPKGSLNAAHVAADVLSKCESLPEEDRAQMKAIATLFGTYYGEALGIENNDPHFGRLTCTNGVVFVEDGILNFRLDLRYGDVVDADKLFEDIKAAMDRFGFEYVETLKKSKAWRLEEDLPIVRRMHRVYQEYSGDFTSPMNYNAGGTYAKCLPNAIEVGTFLSDDRPFDLPAGHGNVHQPDECISIKGFLEAFELNALMVIEADRELNGK